MDKRTEFSKKFLETADRILREKPELFEELRKIEHLKPGECLKPSNRPNRALSRKSKKPKRKQVMTGQSAIDVRADAAHGAGGDAPAERPFQAAKSCLHHLPSVIGTLTKAL